MIRYTPRWRQHRRMFHQYFHKGTLESYESLRQREVNRFLKRALESHQGFDVGHEVRK